MRGELWMGWAVAVVLGGCAGSASGVIQMPAEIRQEAARSSAEESAVGCVTEPVYREALERAKQAPHALAKLRWVGCALEFASAHGMPRDVTLLAMAAVQTAEVLPPSTPEVILLQSQLLDVAIAWHRDMPDRGLAEFQVAIYTLYSGYLTLVPDGDDEAMVAFYLGELLYGMRRFEEAKGLYARSLAADPDSAYAADVERALEAIGRKAQDQP